MDNRIYIVYLINNEVGFDKIEETSQDRKNKQTEKQELEKPEKPDEEQEAKK